MGRMTLPCELRFATCLVQAGNSPLRLAEQEGKASAAALLRADPRVYVAITADDGSCSCIARAVSGSAARSQK